MDTMLITMIIGGFVIGVSASFTGLGGGFLMVPLLLFMGFNAQKAVGTSFMGIFIISVSALFAHYRLENVHFKYGLLLGLGGILGAQIGPLLLEQMSIPQFKKIFAVILMILSVLLFFKK